jgi:ribose transport system substrate-binding protein
MKKSHRLSSVFLLLAGMLIAGCGQQTAPSASEAPPAATLTLGIIPKSTGGEFWETVEKGARKAAEELGIQLKWEGTVTETEFAEQNKIIENMINLDVDGLALAPLNRVAMRKMVAQTVDAGIPVVIFDSEVDGEAHSSFVATDNRAGGALGGKHLLSLLPPASKVMVMRYVQGAGSTEARSEGAMEVIKAAGHGVLADPYADTGTVEGCKTAAANALEGFVKDGKLHLDGIFAANLYSTLGVAEALEDLRKGGIEVQVAFVGFDTSEKLLNEVTAGRIDALVAQNPENMGYLAVSTLYSVVTGDPVDAQVDTGVRLVTKADLEN